MPGFVFGVGLVHYEFVRLRGFGVWCRLGFRFVRVFGFLTYVAGSVAHLFLAGLLFRYLVGLTMFVLMVLVTILVFAVVIVWSLQGIGVMGFLGCDLDVYVVVCMLVAGMPCCWV